MLYVYVLFLCVAISPSVHAGFDPEVLSQSTVRILIKTKQGVVGAASGFIWKNNNQIVTSLHVLSSDPKSKIIVEFGRKKRLAKIKAVLPKADLVLLEVRKPIDGWLPLTEFEAKKPPYKADVSALGFNQGSIGMSTRELRKGFVKPEILKVLLPPAALSKLLASKVLDVTLPIYYLDGSLLPGYSGSPIVNDDGVLIGIGDGGLENGASSVSWVIPATNLDALEKSTLSSLPSAQSSANKVFSVDRIKPVRKRKVGNTEGHFKFLSLDWLTNSILSSIVNDAYAIQNEVSDDLDFLTDLDFSEELDFKEVHYRQFNFVKVKSRGYEQLLNTSGAPANMEQVFVLFKKLFPGYIVDYKRFVFDIYEDGRFGLNIAVPEGVELLVDDNKFLLAQGEMFCRRCAYEIQYHARQLNAADQISIQANPIDFLTKVTRQHWQDLNEEGDYGEYRDFRNIDSFGGHRYVVRTAFSDFDEPFKGEFEFNYFVAATSRDSWFQAQGILNRFDDDFFSNLKKYAGTDCSSDSLKRKPARICHDIEAMFKVLISVHLTSYSNKQFTSL